MEVINSGSPRNTTIVDLEAGPGLGRSRPCNETSMSYVYSLSVLTAYPAAVNTMSLQVGLNTRFAAVKFEEMPNLIKSFKFCWTVIGAFGE